VAAEAPSDPRLRGTDAPALGTDPSRTDVTFRLPARIEHRHLAINMVAAMLEHAAGTDRQFREEMITAFGEAFNNIVIHGYSGRSGGMLRVEGCLGPDQVVLRLMDTGTPVDFSRITPPDLDSMPEGGMGVFIIHALVDDVAYQSGAVNVLSLTKRTSSEPTISR
jgi:serine/threonine-protein kinase RsbW